MEQILSNINNIYERQRQINDINQDIIKQLPNKPKAFAKKAPGKPIDKPQPPPQQVIPQIDQSIPVYNPKKYAKPISQPSKPSNVACIELYQFELKGYPDNDMPTQFNAFVDSPQDECGLIQAHNKGYSKKRSSCDIIKSDLAQTGGNHKNLFEMQEWYGFYQKWMAKGVVDDEYKTDLQNKKNDFIDKIKLLFRQNSKYNGKELSSRPDAIVDLQKVAEKRKKLDETNPTDNNIWKELIDIALNGLHKGAFIYKINVDTNVRVVVFGDFHGSFHTFLRHIYRLYKVGIINDLNTLRIDDNWRIIFLGDVVDRGKYAFEIVSIIMQMMINNNTEKDIKVIFNRGNHEESTTNATNGLVCELIDKFNWVDGDIFISEWINLFFSTLPSAIILKHHTNQFWLSHGGIPKNNDDSVPNLNFNERVIYYSQNDNSIPNQIRWNDFGYTPNNELGFDNAIRKTGYIITQNFVKKFNDTNKIDFIIRAHQDSYANSYLVSTKSTEGNVFALDNKQDVQGIIPNNGFVYINDTGKPISDRNAVYGPIARVKLTGFSKTDTMVPITNDIKIMPVMTLSTNTDMLRYLTHDSFGIIRFDLNERELNQFDKDTNIIDPRKDFE